MTNQVAIKDSAGVVGKFSESLVTDWLAFNSDKSEATVRTYTKAIGNFLNWLSDNEIQAPCREDVINYRNQLCSSKKISTARLYTTAVKIFSKWLASIEIVRLDSADVERRGGKFFLRVWGKGRKGKTARVEISKTVFNQIQDYLNARGSKRQQGEPMFTSTANRNFGQRLQTQSVSRLAKATFRAIGVDSPSITCHSCRHFCASQMLLEGVDIARVQRILRHKDPRTTQIYRHDLEMREDTSIQIISNLLDDVCA